MTTPTIAERVEQLVREGTTTTPAIVAAMPGVSSTSVYAALSKLVQLGKLTRVATGNYVLGSAATPAAETDPASEVSAEGDEPAGNGDEQPAAPRIQWALWDDGDLVFTVDGEHTLQLQEPDVVRLAVWLQTRVA